MALFRRTFSDRPAGAGGFSLSTSGQAIESVEGNFESALFDGRPNEGAGPSLARKKSAVGAEPLLK